MSGNKRKVVLVGTGMVGMSFAYAALNQNVCDELIMIDLNEKRAEGEAMDLKWEPGGVALGPKPRDYSYTLNKKVKRLAMKSVLSAKAQEENLVVIDAIKMDEIKTKSFKNFLKAVNADCKALVVTAENDDIVVKSAANIPGVLVTFANLINVYDILNAKKLVVDQAALAKIEEVFA